jgi:3-hydroxyacyl-CoA dehydrogenase
MRMLNIKKAAVIGAGNMGAQIAAHLANAGIPSILMDIAPSELTPEEQKKGLTLQHPEVRNRVTKTLFDRARKLSPAPFFTPELAHMIRLGNIEDNLPDIKNADWIIEAVLEKPELKRSLHTKIASHARKDAIVTTNTSGLSINDIVQELPQEHRKRFFGTHFFNPPRYMRLLEVIPGKDSDPALLKEFSDFGEAVLGKGIVRCKDTPGFVANRIGCFDMLHVNQLTLEQGLSFEEVDAIFGSAAGRPKTAIFRLNDLVGVDLMLQVSSNFATQLKNDEQVACFRIPAFVEEMVKRGWWGDKKGQGFYKKVKTEKGREIQVLDPKTMEYRPAKKTEFASVAAVAKIKDPAERIRTLCAADDKAAQFAWKHISAVISYSANRIPEIADDVVTVDEAMKLGYNWDLGPFEIWDALGIKEAVARLEKEDRPVPKLVKDLLAAGKTKFYETRGAQKVYFDVSKKDYVPMPTSVKEINLQLLHKNNKVVKMNAGASLVDLGDGVACLEFHSKMNTIGDEQTDMLKESLEEVRKNFVGLVIGNQGSHFSAGANITNFLKIMEKKDWDAMAKSITTYQNCLTYLRYFEKPVVAACHGYTLGAGCETTMGSSYVVASAESYVGLPEVGIGVIPGAGGTKEMLIRHTENLPRGDTPDFYFPALQQAWETIGTAKVSTSAHEAIKLKYLRASETTVVLKKEWLIGEAKARALQMVAEKYRPKSPRTDIPAIGQAGIAYFQVVLHQMRNAGFISEYDQKIGTKLAYILCGGNLSSLQFVSEQYILDLECEVFVSLCGEPKTAERIQHMLKTGKPLRN